MRRMSTRAIILALVISLLPLFSPAAEPVVANRPPRSDEIGYRPADGQEAVLNPPSFVWLHEKEADRYAVQWSTHRDFRDAVRRAAALEAGDSGRDDDRPRDPRE